VPFIAVLLFFYGGRKYGFCGFGEKADEVTLRRSAKAGQTAGTCCT